MEDEYEEIQSSNTIISDKETSESTPNPKTGSYGVSALIVIALICGIFIIR